MDIERLLVQLVVLLVLSPLAEEAIFRAGIQEYLLRRMASPWAANVVTALAFGLLHFLVRRNAEAFAVALPALGLGMVYQRTRRVRWCAMLHSVMNGVWLLAVQAGMTMAIRP